jgi:aminopeptidase N
MPKIPRHRPLAALLLALWAAAVAPLTAGADASAAPLANPPVVAHRIEARIAPDSGRLEVTDRMTLPPGADTWDLILHQGLSPRVLEGDATLEPQERLGHLEHLRLRLGPGAAGTDRTVTLAYGGMIRHDLASEREGMGRERQTSAGTIGPEGVFLDGTSGWYPLIPGTLQRFELKATLPAGWSAVSQGAGPDPASGAAPGPVPGPASDPAAGSAATGVSTWSESQPQDDIYLIAAPFTLYRDSADGIEAQVWLRRPDPRLAAGYLAATQDYLNLYDRLIGPYPYAKFALVENFWESGYGMPSFTLLGPQVIRLPFIVRTSYPHEILHNWWGNGVYVDYQRGNWCEGLTNYLADHLMKEREGQGAAYRRDILNGYMDYVTAAKDFPLAEFRGRHGDASQAVGYGKSAMLFHMLRRQLGDDAFRQGLQRFYADNRFRYASWNDLRLAFGGASGKDLKPFFDAWTGRAGAPRLAVSQVRVEPRGTGFRVAGQLEQAQKGAPFPLTVPVVVHQGRGDPVVLRVDLTGRRADFEIDLQSPPVRLAVDPAFDTFRELAAGESPVSLSSLFGSERGTLVLPAAAPADLLAGYRALADAWRDGHPGWTVVLDREIQTLPKDRPVWLLGWENRFLPELADGGRGFALDLKSRQATIVGQPVDPADTSLVLTRDLAGRPVGWIAASGPPALPGLARKLPHYGKYGYLVFQGDAPDNRFKGQWPAGDSDLVYWFGAARPELALPPEAALVGP